MLHLGSKSPLMTLVPQAAIRYPCLCFSRFKRIFALLIRSFDIITFLHGIQTQWHEKNASSASLKKTSHSNWR